MVIRRTVLRDLSVLAIRSLAGQVKLIADQRKSLYIIGKEVAICLGDKFD